MQQLLSVFFRFRYYCTIKPEILNDTLFSVAPFLSSELYQSLEIKDPAKVSEEVMLLLTDESDAEMVNAITGTEFFSKKVNISKITVTVGCA